MLEMSNYMDSEWDKESVSDNTLNKCDNESVNDKMRKIDKKMIDGIIKTK